MPCYHPLTGVVDGEKRTATGKQLIHIISANQAACIEDQSSVVKIPCGQCIGCRIDYSREWANRLMLELQEHDPDRCFFVTLTYNDDSLFEHCRSDSTVYWTLNKRDLQLFMKRLRRSIEPEKCRFYAVGEYGSKSLRPHFHLILFNVPLNNYRMTDLKKSGLGYMYRSSELLEQLWPYGYNVVAPVTWESCAYTSRYMMKKLKGVDSEWYDIAKIERPFSLCSRKPGIGKAYFDRMEDFAESSFISIGSGDGVKQIPVPAYFERLYQKADAEAAEQRAAFKKALTVERRKLELAGTDLSELEYLKKKEDSLKKRLKILDNTRNI